MTNSDKECEWIDNNPHYYESDQHRENVKHNIQTNYRIRELEGELNTLKKSRRYTSPLN